MTRKIAFHPLLLGIFPVVFLYSHNAELTPAGEMAVPLAAAAVLALSLWAVAYIFIRDARRSALAASLGIMLFFAFGHAKKLTGLGDMRLLSVWAAVFALGVIALARKKGREMTGLTVFMNALSVILVAIPVATSAYQLATREHYAPELAVRADMPKERPDIYYIILDGYARADVLHDLYGYDNRGFTGFLSMEGFYTANVSSSNYAQTPLSIASSLNLVYLDGLRDRVGEASRDGMPLSDMIHDSVAVRFLRSQGYSFVAFSSGYAPTDVKGADVYLKPPRSLSEFQNVLLETTPLPAFLDALGIKTHREFYRDRIQYILDNLGNIPDTGGPVFVFAHITVPHNPFIFDADGNNPADSGRFPFGSGDTLDKRARALYREGFVQQTKFVNRKVMEAVSGIMSRSSRPPVIIIQSDHGPASMLNWLDPAKTNMRERMSILNAYLLPGNYQDGPYNTITPVNTFRMVFNRYFGAGLPLLEDRIYFSSAASPYRFIDVTGRLATDEAVGMQARR